MRLGLIERGYSLVADDVTRITSLEGRELMATAPNLTRNHMKFAGLASLTWRLFSALAVSESRSALIWSSR